MEQLNSQEIDFASGGIAWTTPAIVALADSGVVGPLVWSFGVGYAIGTLAYNAYWS
jgi:hypothetical protein